MNFVNVLFIGVPVIYSLIYFLGVFGKDKYSREKIIKFKVFKGFMYIVLVIVSLLNFRKSVDWLTISIAICEGATNIFESYAEKIEMAYRDKLEQLNNAPINRELKDKENILTDIRMKIDIIKKSLKGSDFNAARKEYYEIEVILRVYKEADILLSKLKDMVFSEKKLVITEEDKIKELYEEFEENFIYLV